jgi:hypothetical protein
VISYKWEFCLREKCKKKTDNSGANTAKSRSKLRVNMLSEELKPIRGMPLKIKEIQSGMKLMPVAAMKKWKKWLD